MKTGNNEIRNRRGLVSVVRVLLLASCFLLLSPLFTYAQHTVLRGKVVDAATGTPLTGALVSAADIEGFSTLTNEAGCYELKIPAYCSAITVSAPDFNTAQVGTGKQTSMPDVRLYPATLSPYHTSLQPPVSRLSPLASQNLIVEDELQRQLGSQVHVTGRSGMPGMGSVMTIDGLSSLMANAQPLIVVDGVIFDQQRDRQLLHGGYYLDVLANISPADVERVTVLRNGVALYGAKGSNGVILIETRRNKSMATRITASLSAGVTLKPRFIDMMGAEQYRSYASELLNTTNTTVSDFKFLNEDPAYFYYGQYHHETDWKEQVYRQAFSQNYGINIEGGDDVANYNLSLGYMQAQSTLKYNDMNRLNVRFNTDINFSQRFHTRFDASFSNLTRNLRDDGTPATYDDGPISSPSFLAYVKSPFLSPYAYAGGVLSDHLDINDETYLDEALHYYQNYNYKLGNPFALNIYGDAENKNRLQNSMLNIAVTPRIDFNGSLSLSEHFSYSLISTNEKYYIPVYGVPDYYVKSLGSTRENEVRSLSAKQNSLMSDTRLQWHHWYGAHHFNVFGGLRLNWESYSLSTQLSYNTGNDKTPFTQKGPNSSADGNSVNWTNIAWYAQAQYDYRQRYFLQLNLTAETSSDFGIDANSGLKAFGARWGLFPGVQVGWVVTNEPWLASHKSQTSILNYLRLSAGLDVTGNDNIDHLAARTYFHSEKYLESIMGLNLGSIGNSRIQWERTTRWNIGLDANLLDNRVCLHLNWFAATTDNLLTPSRQSYLTGLDSNWRNGGKMTNRGYDVALNGRLLATRHWQWEVGASVGHYTNKVTALPATMMTELYGATILTEVGRTANVFYGYQTRGVLATSEQAAAEGLYTMDANGVDRHYFQAGDVWFADLDGNHCINEADRTVIGNPNPDFYGNISTSLHWKRWHLQAQMVYSVGNDVYNYQRSQLEGGQRFMNQTVAMTRRWHGEGHDTDVPRITFQDPMGNSRFSDRWIEDGSYLKLKSVTLSYQLPVNWQFLQGLEFWIQGNNLFTLTKYLGSDPETAVTGSVIGQGIDAGLLPQSRSFVAGVKINL